MARVRHRVGIDFGNTGNIYWGASSTPEVNVLDTSIPRLTLNGYYNLGTAQRVSSVFSYVTNYTVLPEVDFGDGYPQFNVPVWYFDCDIVASGANSDLHFLGNLKTAANINIRVGDIEASTNNAYLLMSFYVRSTFTETATGTTPTYDINVYRQATNNIATFSPTTLLATKTINVDVGDVWQQVTIALPTEPFGTSIGDKLENNDYIFIGLAQQQNSGGQKTGSVTLEFANLCVATKATSSNSTNNFSFYHATPASKYSDVTDDVLDFSVVMGTSDIKSRAVSPTQINLTLNNETGLYNIGTNPDSPLFETTVKNIRLIIQTRNSLGNWVSVASGFVDYISSKGNPRYKQVTVKATLDPLRLSNNQFRFKPDDPFSLYNIYRDVGRVLYDLIATNSWVAPKGGLGVTMDKSLLGYNTVLQDPLEYFTVTSDGWIKIPFVGYDWQDTDYGNIIYSLLETAQLHLWLHKDGTLRVTGTSRLRKPTQASTPSAIPLVLNLFQDNLSTRTGGKTYTLYPHELKASYGADVRNYVQVPYRETYRGTADIIPNPADDVDDEDEFSPDLYWGLKTNITPERYRALVQKLSKLAVWTPEDNAQMQWVIDHFGEGATPDWATFYDWNGDNCAVLDLYLMKDSSDATGLVDGRDISVATESDTPTGTFTRRNTFYHSWVVSGDDVMRIRMYNDGTHPDTYTVNYIRATGDVAIIGDLTYTSYKDNTSIADQNKESPYKIERTELTNIDDAGVIARIVAEDYLYPVQNLDYFTITIDDTNTNEFFVYENIDIGDIINVSYRTKDSELIDNLMIVAGMEISATTVTMVIKLFLINVEEYVAMNLITEYRTGASSVNQPSYSIEPLPTPLDSRADAVIIPVSEAYLPAVALFYDSISGLDVIFTNMSGNTPTSYSWDFGDGSTSTATNPSHTYADYGVYTVSLTATNAVGSHTYTKQVEVVTTGWRS